MANQIALKVLTQPGDDVIVGVESHVVWHEAGAAAANAGVQFTTIGQGGTFSEVEFRAAIKPLDHAIFPPTTLVVIENTHNRGGGIVFPQQDVEAICETARVLGIRSYLDGARLFNTAVAIARPIAELAAPFDLVSVALSKGLGSPVGSVIAGRLETVKSAVRARRMFGGAMRQSGILAAAGLFALENNQTRLREDHKHARILAEGLAATPALLDLSRVQTNIVRFQLPEGCPDAPTVIRKAADHRLMVSAVANRTIRAVTHLDVSEAECRQAIEILSSVLES